MAASSVKESDDRSSVCEDVNPFSFQRFVNIRSSSTTEHSASDKLANLIAGGQHGRQTHRKCLVVVDDKPKAVAHIKRPQSLDLIAHLGAVPARRPSLSDTTDASCPSSSEQIGAAESNWVQEPPPVEPGAHCHLDKDLTERLDEKNKQLQKQLEDAQKVNKEQLRRLKSLEEQLEQQQARERDETAALERMIQQVECSLKAAQERASDAEQLAHSLKLEVKALQARCKQLEQQQHDSLPEMTSDLSCKLRAAADSAEGSLRSLLDGVSQLRLYSQVLESWTKVHEDPS
ncbi:uncharacterized protein LOC144114832 isoform X2 [Amblyomma americanum]